MTASPTARRVWLRRELAELDISGVLAEIRVQVGARLYSCNSCGESRCNL